MNCKYDVPYVGECSKQAITNSDYCWEHSRRTCDVCEKQATRGCSVAVSLVCGMPICNNCNYCRTHK